MLLQRGPLGVKIQSLPFSLTLLTPFIVAFSLPFPDGTNVRSARRHGRSLVISTSPYPNPRRHRFTARVGFLRHSRASSSCLHWRLVRKGRQTLSAQVDHS